MSEEIEGELEVKEAEQDTEEKPQIYVVKKGLGGWKFGRREFLTGAAAAATAAAAVVVAGEAGEETTEPGDALGEMVTLALTMPALMIVQPGRPFVQNWRFTNNGDRAWCKGVKLHLAEGEHLQVQSPISVPDIAPQETANVSVDMVAPADLETDRVNWYLEMPGMTAPIASGLFVLQMACIAESDHPYAANADESWMITNPDTNAQRTRVHFSQVEVEEGYDYVIIRDDAWQEVQQITGFHTSGLWSNSVPGRNVWLQLTSDSSNEYWGFCLDQVETVQEYHVYMPIVVKQPTLTPTPTPIPTATPCSCYGVCTCNPHCTCDTIHYWYPN